MRLTGIAAVVVTLIAMIAVPGRALAEIPGLPVTYGPNYNMVGGPTGTDFSAADPLYSFNGSSYVTGPGKIAVGCQGYWAYFVNPTLVTLPLSTGPTAACPINAGWTMVGNPFSGIAQLPAGMTAFHWNPDENRYDSVSSIPPGGSVWIQSDTAGSVTLTYVPVAAQPAQTYGVGDTTTGPVTMHVGDYLKVVLGLYTPSVVTADSNYLHLDSAGISGPLTCLGDPTCSLTMTNQFWIYHALAAGTTALTITPQCAQASPPCGVPTRVIPVNILP